MPAWIVTLLLRYGVPLAIQILKKTGFINAAEALAIKFGVKVKEIIDNTQTYSSPTDFPVEHGQTIHDGEHAENASIASFNEENPLKVDLGHGFEADYEFPAEKGKEISKESSIGPSNANYNRKN